MRFPLETCKCLRVLRDIVGKKLQCYIAVQPMQPHVLGLVHYAHPAPTESVEDAVMRDGLSDERVGVRHSAAMLAPSTPPGGYMPGNLASGLKVVY